ncbi:MAG: ABC transporter permease [Nanoarchaeota archaeon]
MRLSKCLKHAFDMVLHSKLRSWLTIIGIVIGVAAVIAITSIGAGLQAQVNSQLSTLGGDLLTITAGASRGGGFFGHGDFGGGGSGQATSKSIILGRSDVQILKGIPEVGLVETEIRGSVNISYLGKSGKVNLNGVDPSVWAQITTLKVAEGRFLDATDQNVIVVGGRLASNYFDQPLGINKMLAVEGSLYRVVGVLDDTSTNIYMPITLAFQVIPNKEKDQYDSIIVKVRNEDELDASIVAIEERMRMSRHVTNATQDFSVSSNKAFQETRAQTLSSMNAFLLAIAAVSLIVGAVGIANTMFTSVLERTKEIGIMKAIGARNFDILRIFLFNAAFIGLVGGIIGAIFGIILSGFLPAIMGGTIPFSRGGTFVSFHSILLALAVSVIVGIAAGIIPAYQASKLKPVDALRYE